MLRHARTLATSLALGAAFAAPALAQTAAPAVADSAATAAPAAVTGATPAPEVGPTRDALVAGVRPAQAPAAGTEAAAVSAARVTRSQAQALMIVGAAALVIGLVIGDDAGTLFALGGAAVGLYGLYVYMR
jgi:hypothetical protein